MKICAEMFTDVEETWTGCDACDSWFHFTCFNTKSRPLFFYHKNNIITKHKL